ncbi:hypothetical protein LEP1GSC016_3916 [Leptospira borgpetersenii serovar Hardjo-bovis str. Sponselee]|uniref:Uncharacterized protein n=1 Tax=Leptospira borgpetersenii serovar Hardjo-bovis str. Sponselee TaxID=1303729 RepID=M6C9B1_LEPBO|nr:hypothetical protein LEP1GSC016_3916 [Leptospira borgpetersenii serovar Hardjo-bovis str. Sponselee]
MILENTVPNTVFLIDGAKNTGGGNESASLFIITLPTS